MELKFINRNTERISVVAEIVAPIYFILVSLYMASNLNQLNIGLQELLSLKYPREATSAIILIIVGFCILYIPRIARERSISLTLTDKLSQNLSTINNLIPREIIENWLFLSAGSTEEELKALQKDYPTNFKSIRKWNIEEWQIEFSNLANAIVNSVGNLIKEVKPLSNFGTIGCNLMISIDSDIEVEVLERFTKKCFKNDSEVLYKPYDPIDGTYYDGIREKKELKGYLILLGKSSEDGSPSGIKALCLRIPIMGLKKLALPGATLAFTKALYDTKRFNKSIVEYVRDGKNHKDFHGDIGITIQEKWRNEIAGGVTKSFLSVPIFDIDDNPIGVLNIDSDKPNFLQNDKIRSILIDMIVSYYPLIAIYAYIGKFISDLELKAENNSAGA